MSYNLQGNVYSFVGEVSCHRATCQNCKLIINARVRYYARMLDLNFDNGVSVEYCCSGFSHCPRGRMSQTH